MIEFEGSKKELNLKEYTDIFQKTLTHNIKPNNLEHKLAKLTNRKYAVCVDNATNGLYFALSAYNIGPGDDVLVTDFSWISTASCIIRAGATPIFCSVDPDTYCISPKSIKKMLTPKTKALIYTPLFGALYDTSNIIQFCKDNNIIFIEDAAQTFGSSYKGRPGGADGDCSVISFNSNKVISSPVGGGVFLTDSEEKASYVRDIRKHGDYKMLGYNAIMHPLAIEIIDYKLNYLDVWQQKRQDIASEYIEILEKTGLKYQKHDCNHNYHKFVIEFEDEEEYNYGKQLFNINNIQTNKHYRKPLHKIFSGVVDESCEDLTKRIMSIPIYAQLTHAEINKIKTVLKQL